jgi:hypothetical protein
MLMASGDFADAQRSPSGLVDPKKIKANECDI